MNLILLDEHELDQQQVTLRDRRAQHIVRVIKAGVGERLRVGVVGVGRGFGTVVRVDTSLATQDIVTINVGELGPQPAGIETVLTLAMPRPKVVPRVVAAAASMGVARIELTNAWRVDKSYFGSPSLSPNALAAAARLGCEQGGFVQVPTVTVFSRFMLWLEGLPQTETETRVAAHPGSPTMLDGVGDLSGRARLAIGPEGGWIRAELDSLEGADFDAVSIGLGILRVETAVAALLGQLELLRSGDRDPQ